MYIHMYIYIYIHIYIHYASTILFCDYDLSFSEFSNMFEVVREAKNMFRARNMFWVLEQKMRVTRNHNYMFLVRTRIV